MQEAEMWPTSGNSRNINTGLLLTIRIEGNDDLTINDLQLVADYTGIVQLQEQQGAFVGLFTPTDTDVTRLFLNGVEYGGVLTPV